MAYNFAKYSDRLVKKKTRVIQESDAQLTLSKHSVESCIQRISDLTQIICRLIGKFRPLDVTP